MKKIIPILLISIQSIIAQEILNNDSILEMIEIGFEESLIIDKINNSQNTFETSISSLKDLKSKGISQNILSAIIKASKQKTESITNNNSTLTDLIIAAPEYNDTEFNWENGKGKLTSVKYYSNGIPVSRESIAEIITKIMMEAKFSLKNGLSFVPYKLFIMKREKYHKSLTKNDNTPYIAMLSYGGTNSYGAESEEYISIGIEPVLDEIKIPEVEDLDETIFTFKKMYVDGMSINSSGYVIIAENYLKLNIDASNMPAQKILLKDKKILGNNHRKAHIEGFEEEVTATLEYNANEAKYKSNAGVLVQETSGVKLIYVLNKTSK